MPSKKTEATASQWVLFKRILALAKFQRHWILQHTAQFSILPDSEHGYGRLNALSAVQLAQQY
jgi:hypothetical protein